ncbi:MAG TPA: hypothetical protein GX509_08750 [Firmicutes bacterium]|nr:hypothetical protein [Bacillota bacterium]
MEDPRPGRLNAIDVAVITNAPGEVAGWVTPFCRSMHRRNGAARIWIFLTPCPFSTGHEMGIARQLPGVSGVFTPSQTISFILSGKRPRGFDAASKGVVAHLGGDFWYSARISKRLGFRAVAYSDRSATCISSFEAFAVEDERVKDKLAAKGVRPDAIQVIGNLMIDGVKPSLEKNEARAAFGIGNDEKCVLLLPGSRPKIARYFVPFLLEVARTMKSVDRSVKFLYSVSPFIMGGEGPGYLIGHNLDMEQVKPEERFNAMVACDLAIALPGTVTAELAVSGTPMIIAVPLRHWDVVPLPGIFGLLGAVPGIGRAMKYLGVKRALQKVKYLALPNKRARKYIVPELVGKVSPQDVAIAGLELLQDHDRLGGISKELRDVMGPPGASERLVDMVLEIAARGTEE